MLVLSRKDAEEIVLCLPDGETVRVAVVRIEGGKVRIGVEAGPRVKIVRGELLDQPRRTGAA